MTMLIRQRLPQVGEAEAQTLAGEVLARILHEFRPDLLVEGTDSVEPKS